MKKLAFVLSALLIAASVSAQSITLSIGPGFEQSVIRAPRFGAVLGMNVSKVNYPAYVSKIGVNAGIEVEYPFTGNVYADAKLLYSDKGDKLDLGDIGKESVSLGYIEAPIHIGYKVSLMDSFSVFADAGPYLAFGVLYNHHFESKLFYDYYSDVEDERKNWNRFDMGLGINAGVEVLKHYRLSVGYDWGLLGLFKDGDYIDADSKTTNLNFHLRFAYMF